MRVPRLLLGVLVTLVCCAPPNGSEVAPLQTGSSAAQWQTLSPLPTPRTEVTGAAAGGSIYVIGGFAEGGGTVATVEVYEPATDSWSEGPDVPIAVNHAMATGRRGNVFVLGGYRGPGLTRPTRRAFLLRSGRWRALPRMPYPVAAGGAVRIGDRIFIVGGVRANDAGEHVLSDHTLVYDISDDRWRVRPPVTTLRQHLGAAAFDGKVYVVGGRTHGLDSNLGVVERLDPTTGEWEKLPDLPTARGGLAATATDNGYVVAVGGESPSGTNPEAEAFEVSSGSWLSLSPLPTPRHGLAVVAVGNVVYVIGGGPEPGLTYSDANEAIDLTEP